jgi:hypothetical protein
MGSLSLGSPIPNFHYYFSAVAETTAETVAVSESAVGVFADAAEKTGLPRDCFEVHEISRDEYERGLRDVASEVSGPRYRVPTDFYPRQTNGNLTKPQQSNCRRFWNGFGRLCIVIEGCHNMRAVG